MTLDADFSNWRVLVIDDEPDNLHLASEVLTFCGAIVEQASAGRQALDIVDEFGPSLILLDLAMPDIDGWEIHRRLRARPEFNQVPIIALTALAMPQDAEKVKQAGFDGYITKPFFVKTLLKDIVACVAAFQQEENFEERRSGD